MTDLSPASETREMNPGEWYWVSKPAIREYVPKVGFLAMAVYHFLASMTDDAQSCYPSQQYVAQRLGCSRSSVSRAINKLSTHKLISATKNGKSQRIYLLLRVKGCSGGTEMSHPRNPGVAQVDTNKTSLTRISNNIVRVSLKKPLTGVRPKTNEELLALDIGEALADTANTQKYLSYTHRYPESLIREVLSQVKQTPAERIRKNRAALFAYLINHYAKG